MDDRRRRARRLGGGLSWKPASAWVAALVFVWLLVVMLWCAFGVIEQAEHLADTLGEPLGTLILTISIVVIEVGLISAVMLGSDANPTVGRDTMFAVMMIVLNGVVGLSLLVGGLRHHEQSYSLPGASAYLVVIIPLTVVALVIPSVTTSTTGGTLTTGQAISFSALTIVLYGIFLAVQTGRTAGSSSRSRTARWRRLRPSPRPRRGRRPRRSSIGRSRSTPCSC